MLLIQRPESGSQNEFRSTWAVVDIAIGPNPEVNLIDMLAFVTLSRTIMEDYWVPKAFAEQGTVLAKALRDMEEDIWSVGARVLDREQQEELRALIWKWREQNPEMQYVTASDSGTLSHNWAIRA